MSSSTTSASLEYFSSVSLSACLVSSGDFCSKIYHPDEPKIIREAMGFSQEIADRRDLRYPTAFHYSLGSLVWPAKKLIESRGGDPYPVVYVTGRVLSVLLGKATILLVYALAKRINDRRHALIASSALAFSMYHVTNSAWATTDVTSSFLLSSFLILTFKTMDDESLLLAVTTGAALGLLVGAKYTGAIAIMPWKCLAQRV